MRIADSHEFIEVYRGSRDLRIGMEMVGLRPDVEFDSFAPEVLSSSDRALYGVDTLSQVELPTLPDRMRLHLLPGKTVRFARKEAGGKFSLMKGYGAALAAARPDVVIESVYTWLTPRSYTTARVAKQLGVPVVYYDAGDDVAISLQQKLVLPFERPTMLSASRVMTFNGTGRSRFLGKYGYPAERIRIIPKPVEVQRWRPMVDPACVRAELGIPPEAFVVCYIGRLAKVKGSRALADVASLAASDPTMAHWRFLLVGSALDSDEDESDYRSPNTIVTGMLAHDELPPLITVADAIVYPDIAHRPGFWTSVAESMAAAKPLVVGLDTQQDCLPLTDGVDACFVEPGDPRALLEALTALERDPALRDRLGSAVGRYAAEHMDYPRVAAAWLDVLDEAVAEHRSRVSG